MFSKGKIWIKRFTQTACDFGATLFLLPHLSVWRNKLLKTRFHVAKNDITKVLSVVCSVSQLKRWLYWVEYVFSTDLSCHQKLAFAIYTGGKETGIKKNL